MKRMNFTPLHPIQNTSPPPAGVKTKATKPVRRGPLKEGCGPGPEARKVQVCPGHVSPRHIWTQWLAFTDDRDLVPCLLGDHTSPQRPSSACAVPQPHPASNRQTLPRRLSNDGRRIWGGECCERQEGDSYRSQTTRFPDRAQNYPFPSQYRGGLS